MARSEQVPSDRADLDRFGLMRLSEAACWRFLERHHLGRVGIIHFDRPLIYPVNYTLDGHSVVFRTAPGTKLVSVALGEVVTFEVDEADPLFERGTSVMVHGHLHEVSDRGERERLLRLPLHPWAPGDRDHVVRIAPEWISGRQIVGSDIADGLGVDGG